MACTCICAMHTTSTYTPNAHMYMCSYTRKPLGCTHHCCTRFKSGHLFLTACSRTWMATLCCGKKRCNLLRCVYVCICVCWYMDGDFVLWKEAVQTTEVCCVCLYVYVCVCVCIYIYIYIYLYTHTHTHTRMHNKYM